VRCNPRREPTVDDWQAERVAQIGLDADRRRDEHRSEGAAAIARIKGRGESIASIAATQALGGEQAEEHGGRSAPIGDAGASTRPWCERRAGRLAQARVAAESTERARRLVGWRGSSRRCGSREHRCAAQDCRCRVSGALHGCRRGPVASGSCEASTRRARACGWIRRCMPRSLPAKRAETTLRR
jgi:hypothetical protein